jgi:enoyl-CoA hydratase/carnithine racemase
LHGSWAHIRIARPEKRNALNHALRINLLEALDDTREHARVIVITGTDRWFCCGADIKERAENIALGRPDNTAGEGIEIALALKAFPGVVITAVNGLALGFGVNLVNCSDLSIAADTAQFGLPELRSSSYASMSAATSKFAGLAPKRLGWLIYGTEPIDAARAERWGLVSEVVPAPELDERVASLAQRISSFDYSAIVETKAALKRLNQSDEDWRAAMEAGQSVSGLIRQRQGLLPI